jgi:pyridoxamine 5'-phosphate oxidase
MPSDHDHKLSLAALREEYRRGSLDEEHCETNPIVQFELWFSHAQAADLKEPNAMTLATSTPAGHPSARVVLLKEVSDAGFVFFTNCESRKAQELIANPFCALTFYWAELERQVRVEGRSIKLPKDKSQAYFQQRPRGSKLGAWASHQSSVLPGRNVLENRLRIIEAQYPGDDVPMPDYWGGYCVIPESIEFWQGRPNRLHDRLRYRRHGERGWAIDRLSP